MPVSDTSLYIEVEPSVAPNDVTLNTNLEFHWLERRIKIYGIGHFQAVVAVEQQPESRKQAQILLGGHSKLQ